MAEVTVTMTDGRATVFQVDESRLNVLRDFAKACKMDIHGGTYFGVDLDSRIMPQIIVMEKSYFVTEGDLLDRFLAYLDHSKQRIWSKKWQKDEENLMAGFSDTIAKDGS